MKDHDQQNWYAVRVKYKSEKIVLAQLARKGINAYAPMRRYSRRYLRKIVHHTVPVLPTYVFVQVAQQDFIRVLETEYVYSFVKIGRQLSPVSMTEIEILRRIEGLDDAYLLSEAAYSPGQRVRVSQGPLFGMEGIVEHIKSKGRLIVNFDSLGIALQIEINMKQLEPSAS